MFCAQCGQRRREGDRFCSVCGAGISDASTENRLQTGPEYLKVTRQFETPVVVRNNERGVTDLIQKAVRLAEKIGREFASDGWELPAPPYRLRNIFLEEIVSKTGSETKVHLVMEKKRWIGGGVTVILKREVR
jgi:hypothetical protein